MDARNTSSQAGKRGRKKEEIKKGDQKKKKKEKKDIQPEKNDDEGENGLEQRVRNILMRERREEEAERKT